MRFYTYKKIVKIASTYLLFKIMVLFPVITFADPILSELPQKDRIVYFEQAKQSDLTGIAIKTKPVLARPAKEGEIITTTIKGEGIETISAPANIGDWVVQNICPETGNEEILVKKDKFIQRYEQADVNKVDVSISTKEYHSYIPKGVEMNYFIIPKLSSPFVMQAPWGELQRFQAGDAVVQSITDNQDIYRIQKDAFNCTYTILKKANL